jgi:hypothetical protein
MYERVGKHMCTEARLLPRIWRRVADTLLAQCAEWDALASKCFEGGFEPDVGTIRESMHAVAPLDQ